MMPRVDEKNEHGEANAAASAGWYRTGSRVGSVVQYLFMSIVVLWYVFVVMMVLLMMSMCCGWNYAYLRRAGFLWQLDSQCVLCENRLSLLTLDRTSIGSRVLDHGNLPWLTTGTATARGSTKVPADSPRKETKEERNEDNSAGGGAVVSGSGITSEDMKMIHLGKNTSFRFAADVPFLEAIETCDTLRCIRDAHLQPRGKAKFNFPHFIIAGYSKSATTSLFRYLITHPSVATPARKVRLACRCTL